MLPYLCRRVVVALVVLWVIITITFLLLYSLPGGPFTGSKRLPEAVERNLQARYRLEEPFWAQYCAFLGNLLRGDLGPSYRYQGQSVNQLLREAIPVSFTLGGLALGFSFGVGVPLGVWGAVRKGTRGDRLLLVATSFAMSLPTFVVGPLLLYLFALRLSWLPPALWGGPAHLLLPVISLSLFPLALVIRLVRGSLARVLAQDYLWTARAKGLPERVVIYRHALPNALIPVLAYLGPLAAGILTGSFVVERVFALPGLGEHFVAGIHNRDYGLIMGVTLLYSILLLTLNLVVDLVCAWTHPWFRLGSLGRRGNL